MSAPIIFMSGPLLLAIGAYALGQRRTLVTALAVLGVLALAGLAGWLPLDERGPGGILIQSTFTVLGRKLVMTPDTRPALGILFFQAAVLLGAARWVAYNRWFVPVGLSSLSLFSAALFVQPVVFAAVFIELAAVLMVTILVGEGHRLTRGAMRFFTFMTLGMMVVLLSGWVVEAIQANPTDASLTLRGTVLLALGFAILLGVAPFHSWLPVLVQQAPPLATAWVLTVMRTPVVFLLIRFLHTYPWLSQNPGVSRALILTGGGLALLGALFLFSQRNFSRSMGYAHLAETGALLLALGLDTETGIEIAIWGLIVHGLAVAVWSLSLDDVRRTEITPPLPDDFTALQGLGRRRPFVAATLLLSLLSIAGFPFTAGFTARWALLHELAQIHPTAALLLLVGTASLGLVCARGLATLLLPEPDTQVAANSPLVLVRRLLREPPSARGVYGFCLGVLLLIGLFPQWFVAIAHWATQAVVKGGS